MRSYYISYMCDCFTSTREFVKAIQLKIRQFGETS